jgi:hypothetical protein
MTRRLLLALVLAAGAVRAQASDTIPPPPPPPDDDAPGVEAPPPEALPPPQPPDPATVEQRLSQYGHWVDTPEYSRVWIPDGVRPDWQPYTDGRWVYTEWGWSFVPDVPWGAIVFHFGRWGFRADLGWFWVPGYVWAPAWVSWRYIDGYVCWAPFGPRGYVYPRRWPGWVVVPARYFGRPIVHHVLPRPQALAIVRAAKPVRSIAVAPARGHFYGPPHAWIRGAPRARGHRR